MNYLCETILVEEENDVEAHGIRHIAAAVVIVAASAGGTLLAQGGTALAPEPATLDGDLWGAGSTAPALYVDSYDSTTAFQLGSSWSYNPSVPAGAPCATWAMPAGEVTDMVVQASGNWRRCM